MPWHYLQDKKKSIFWCLIGVYAATNPKKKNLFEKKKSENAYFARHRLRKKKRNQLLCLADKTGKSGN